MSVKIKKTVGIVTFLYTNYGALLQAYALQRYLKNENVEVLNIYFKTKWHQNDERVFKLYGSFKSKISQLFFTVIRYRGLYNRKHRTDLFRNKYFNLSTTYRTIEDFVFGPPEVDIYISGSDQVFNPYGDYRDVFYLNFDKRSSKKIAYSASFGINEFTEEVTRIVLPLVQDFDAISCREKDGADYLRTILGKEAYWVVDPTFLLTAQEWEKVCILPKLKSKYIFVYALADEKSLIEIAKRIKKKTGFKIICVRGNTRDFISADKCIYGSGPAEFIGLIRNAEYVITDSYHGTIFSIIFNKAFYTFISRPKVASRIYSLINLLQSSDRIITKDSFNSFTLDNEVAVPKIEKLEEMIKHSKMFISKEILL
jgi:polysaccharide pyruvyl transferase WcaK-like protein